MKKLLFLLAFIAALSGSAFAQGQPRIGIHQIDLAGLQGSKTFTWTSAGPISNIILPSVCVVDWGDSTSVGVCQTMIHTYKDTVLRTVKISPYSGLSAFTDLVFQTGYLSTLDLHNFSLHTLDCSGNILTTLTISGSGLKELSCESNNLSSLSVSGFASLTYLDCHQNSLTSLNVSGATHLAYLDCSANSITSLNVSGLTSLAYLNCNSNTTLGTLNVTGCTGLVTLTCYSNGGGNNAITSFDASGLTALTSLTFFNNVSLVTLNISGCTNIAGLQIQDNYSLHSPNLSGFTHLSTLNIIEDSSITKLDISGCTSLTSISSGLYHCRHLDSIDCRNSGMTTAPQYLGGSSVDNALLISYFNGAGCAFGTSEVNTILHGLATGSVSNGICDLSGGTNAAPTGQGITDKATLIGRGWTVTTN